MNDYLLRHAVANVWCNPGQDRQFVYRLSRLTPKYGVRHTINLFYERLTLPTQGDTYHVYQIGQALPSRIGVPHTKRQWMSLAYLANEHLLHTDLYTEEGIHFPRFESFIWITPSRNVIVAVKINPRIYDLESGPLYLRFYSNAYFQSERSDLDRYLIVKGMRVTDDNALLTFQREVRTIVNERGGFPQYFVNGRFVHNISLVTAEKDDAVEFVLDSSIKRMVEFKPSDLKEFESTLDQERKYILHYDEPDVDTIEYLDDVDLYLYKPGIQDRFMGVYYHHNEGTWLRMLTHKDYSISIERLGSFVDTHPTDPRHQLNPERWGKDDWQSLQEVVLRLYIRESGYHRPLVADSHRIQELYRLSSDKILDAMTGLNAVNPLWKAEALEQSPYVRFMSASDDVVYPIAYNDPYVGSDGEKAAQEFVGDVYGYHAAATHLAKTPSHVYTLNGVKYADLAFEHQLNSTVFEYDTDGVLLEWHYHVNGTYYIPRNANTVKVEALTGKGDFHSNTVFGNAPVEIAYGHNFRVYVKDVWALTPVGEWSDITDAADRHTYGFLDTTVTPNRWVWTLDDTTHYGAVAVDDGFLCYDLMLTRTDGHLRFSLASVEVHDGVEDERVLDLPFGQLDVYLDGRPLIEGLDYVVHWPEVVLSHLEYLGESTTHKLTIRGYGFADSSLSRLPTTESGFIRYGVLSMDRVYNIWTHKVLRLVVDGHYHDPADLVFDEDRGVLTIDGERNGAPYAIQTPPVVFRDVYPHDRQARADDDQRDEYVANYMDEYFPKPVRPNPDFIETQYHIISPFANKVLHDLLEGHFYPPGIEDQYSEHEIREWCKDYEWLLPYDLCNQEYVDSHIEIYPHWHPEPVELNLYQYNFYVRILETYLRHPPDVTPFVAVKSLRG